MLHDDNGQECYVPGRVMAKPIQAEDHGKFYAVSLYTGQQVISSVLVGGLAARANDLALRPQIGFLLHSIPSNTGCLLCFVFHCSQEHLVRPGLDWERS